MIPQFNLAAVYQLPPVVVVGFYLASFPLEAQPPSHGSADNHILHFPWPVGQERIRAGQSFLTLGSRDEYGTQTGPFGVFSGTSRTH